jgi:uncharacterized protein (DUF1697 family)
LAHVVFLRAANVGGKNVFRPAQLARALKHLDVVNVGAAGTFVVRAQTTSAAIREAISGELPFVCEMVVRPAREVSTLVDGNPFDGVSFTRDLRGFVAALCTKLKARPPLPMLIPSAANWGMRVDYIDGAFALGIWRRAPNGFVMPSSALEKALGVPATVRWWETYERISRVIG